jgi:DNA-binding transcriptional ArsR family regulator
VSDAIGVIGNRVRVELLHTLGRHGPRTTVALAGDIGVAIRQTSEHLSWLRAAGLVTVQPDEGARGHLRAVWDADHEAVDRLIGLLVGHLRGA